MPLQYALVAYVRNDIGGFVDGLRRELHPEHAHLAAHVTILPPRTLSGTESQAVEHIEGICESVDPFEVTLGEVQTFMPVTPTVFLRVARGAYRVRELHERLNTGALAFEEPWPFMPHLTLFKMETNQHAQAALPKAMRRWEEFTGAPSIRIEQLSFVRSSGSSGDCWVEVASIVLGQRLAVTR